LTTVYIHGNLIATAGRNMSGNWRAKPIDGRPAGSSLKCLHYGWSIIRYSRINHTKGHNVIERFNMRKVECYKNACTLQKNTRNISYYLLLTRFGITV